MVIGLHVMQFCSKIILVISNQILPVHLFDFEIMHLISDQIALNSVQLPLHIIIIIIVIIVIITIIFSMIVTMINFIIIQYQTPAGHKLFADFPCTLDQQLHPSLSWQPWSLFLLGQAV